MTSTLRPAPTSSAAISAAITDPLPFARAVGPAMSVRTPTLTLPPLRFAAPPAVCAGAGVAETARAKQTAARNWKLEWNIVSSRRRPFGRAGMDCSHSDLDSIRVYEMFAVRTRGRGHAPQCQSTFPRVGADWRSQCERTIE